MQLFHERYFEDEYRTDEKGKQKKNIERIARIDKPLEDITVEDILMMSNAILRETGHLGYSPSDYNPRDGPMSDIISLRYENHPKSSFYMYGVSKNCDFTEHISSILEGSDSNRGKNIRTSILENIASIISYSMPFTEITIRDHWLGNEMTKSLYEAVYDGQKMETKVFNKGPWLDDLKEIYNALVESKTRTYPNGKKSCLISDYWSKPKHITEDSDWWQHNRQR